MQKCFGELLAILIYLTMIVLFLIGSVQLALNGKPWVPVLEFLIAYAIDQVKSVPVQFFAWFFVIRRCGTLEVNDFEEWSDDLIF